MLSNNNAGCGEATASVDRNESLILDGVIQ